MSRYVQVVGKNGKKKRRLKMSISKIAILGAGGVGFWLTVALARNGRDERIGVWDDDDFQGGTGASRLPRVSNPAVKKVDVLRGHLRMVFGTDLERFEFFPNRLTITTIDGLDLSDTLIVDCTDMTTEARSELWAVARRQGATMLRVSYDGNGIVVISRGLPISLPGANGYALVPSLAQSFMAAGLGAEAVRLILEGKEVTDLQVEVPYVGREV